MLHEVHLLRFPVPLWARAQEQLQALLREFTMIALGQPEADDVPQRLLALMAALEARFPRVSDEPEGRIAAAQAAGEQVIDDLLYPSVTEGAEAVTSLLSLLKEADDYCARLPEMNVLAADPEAVRFRTWYLASFVDQIHGKPPVSWTAWPDSS